jgi:hypothetical protein
MIAPAPVPPMLPDVLLAELRSVANGVPDFSVYRADSRPHLVWVGRAHALITRWNALEGASFSSTANFLGIDLLRESNVGKLLGILHRAIADLELQYPAPADQVFGPGAVYDFFKALRDLLGSASTSVFIVDPYLDETVVDHYLTAIPGGVGIRLLCRDKYPALVPAVEKFSSQFGQAIELRSSRALHDRVIFVDELSCWVLGMSIRDALTKGRTTYLAPLSADLVEWKAGAYEETWTQGERLFPKASGST